MIAAISLEAPSAILLEQLIEQNRMPNLAALQRAGEIINLEPPFLDGSVYATLYTGQPVSEHGIYSLFTWSASEQRLRLSYDLMPSDTIFHRLDRAGKRVLAIDPAEHPVQELENGVVVSGCQFRSRVHLARWSSPARVGRELSKSLGRPARGEETFGRPSESHLLYLNKVFTEAPDRLARAVERLAAGKPPDVLWISMAAIHVAGHQLWDPATLDVIGRTPAGTNVLEGSLHRIYEAADVALGRIVNFLPHNADLLLFWPKGMGHETSRSDLLAGMLERILKPAARTRTLSGGDTLTTLRAMVPATLRSLVADAIPNEMSLRLTARLATIRKDWTGEQAFSLPSDGPGLIRINLRGRERNGIVPSSDAHALCEKISEGLQTFSDMGGGPCIATIDHPQDLLPSGRNMDALPDLIVRWSDESAANLLGVTSPEYGTVWRQGVGSGRSGNHRPGARAIVIPGSKTYRSIDGRAPQLIDLSATVCAAVGVPHDDLPGQSFLI